MSSAAGSRVRRLVPLAALFCVTAFVSGTVPVLGVSDVGTFQGEGDALQDDLDLRAGSVEPSALQRRIVADLGATATWNRFGTPQSLTPAASGYLATGLPVDELAAARSWLEENRALFRLSAEGVRSLAVVRDAPIGDGRAITFQQTFGALPAGIDGRVTLGLVDGNLAYVSSSIAPHASIAGTTAVSAQQAMQLAGARAGRSFALGDISGFRRDGREAQMTIDGFTGPQTALLVAVPTPRNGVRPAWLTQLIDTTQPLGLATYVDALTGATLVRESLVDYAIDNPTWDVFPASPPLDYSSTDTRETWCWVAGPAATGWSGTRPHPTPGTCSLQPGCDRHLDREQRRVLRELEHGQPVQGRARSGDRVADPRLSVRLDEPVVRGALRPGGLRVTGAKRHRRGNREPVRDAQSDARLRVLAGLHRDRVQSPVVQLRSRRQGPRSRDR